MSLTELSVKRPTALVAIFALCIGLGVMGYSKLGADLFPSTNVPYIVVQQIYPGAGSTEIENELMKPIEEAVSSLPGIKSVKTVSAENFGYVVLEFTMDTDSDTAVMDTQKAVDAVAGKLPSDADRPVVSKVNLNAMPILVLSIAGTIPYEDLYAQADSLKRSLENVKGVGQVTLEGAPKKRVEITLDRMALESWGLGFQTVIGILKANNLNAPAGQLDLGGTSRSVRVIGQVESLEELRGLLLPLPRGGSVPLGEVAEVGYAYERNAGIIRMNSRSAIGMTVVKANDANVVATAKLVKKAIAKEQASMPAGVELKVASDDSVFITESLNHTMRDLIIGIISTAIVLYLFLREWRNSLIVLVAIPTSLVSTFFMMYVLGFTLNIVSTTALALCIGILVDDSIVVLENIHRHHALGEDPRTASINGRREIAMAAIAITLSDVVVFAPVAFLSDLVGQFFRQFGLTIVFAALFSLFVSFTLTPALASRLVGKGKAPHGTEAEEPRPGEPAGGIGGLFDRTIKPLYRGFLEWSLKHRAAVLAGIVALFVGSIALIPLGLVQSEFMPQFDQGKLVIDVSLDSGAEIGRTDKVVKLIEEHLLARPETVEVFSQIGTGGMTNKARILYNMVPKTERKKGQSAIAREVRALGATIPGANVSVTEPSIIAQTSADGSKPLIMSISGPDRTVISDIASRVEGILRATPGVVDVDNTIRSRSTEIALRVDRLALAQYGLTVADAAMALRTALEGTQAGVFRRAGDEYDMIVRFSPDQVRTPSELASIRIANPVGMLVSIGQVAELGRAAASSTLNRSGRQNVATIQANLEGRALSAVSADISKRLQASPAPRGYKIEFKGDTSMMTDSFANLAWALAASIGLLYLVLLVLYESYLTPVIRMLSLPVGIIGGLLALALTGKAINIVVFIGIIMLDGLASKNGTLLIDYTNTLVKRGMSLREALLESGTTRIRPIMMTSVTMVVGMLPLALSRGSSSEMMSSMAILLIGGITTSTLLSPILIPVVYTLIDDGRHGLKSRRATRRAASMTPAEPVAPGHSPQVHEARSTDKESTAEVQS